MGVWIVVIFVLSVMRVVGGVPLWVECVFRRVDDVCVVHPFDIVALTEIRSSNEEVNNRRVVMEYSTHGVTLHHVPRNSGRTGGGVGVLINDRVKLVTRLEPINKAVSFESMEMIITIVSISTRLVFIYLMPPSKKEQIKTWNICY